MAGRQRWLDAGHLKGKERKSVLIRMNHKRGEFVTTLIFLSLLLVLSHPAHIQSKSFSSNGAPKNTAPPSHLHTLAFYLSLCFGRFSESLIPFGSISPSRVPPVRSPLCLIPLGVSCLCSVFVAAMAGLLGPAPSSCRARCIFKQSIKF